MPKQYLNPKNIETIKERIQAVMRFVEEIIAEAEALYRSALLSEDTIELAYPIQRIKERISDLTFIYHACYKVLTSSVDTYARAEEELLSKLDELQHYYYMIFVKDKNNQSASQDSVYAVYYVFDGSQLPSVEIPDLTAADPIDALSGMDKRVDSRSINPHDILREAFPIEGIDLDLTALPAMQQASITTPDIISADGYVLNPIQFNNSRTIYTWTIEMDDADIQISLSKVLNEEEITSIRYAELMENNLVPLTGSIENSTIDAFKAIERLEALVDQPDFIPDSNELVKLVFNGLFVTLPTALFIDAVKKISTLSIAHDDDTTAEKSLHPDKLSITPNIEEDGDLWPSEDTSVTRNDLAAAHMSESEKNFIRILYLLVGGSSHHNSPVSVVFRDHFVNIPASQLLSLLDIKTPHSELTADSLFRSANSIEKTRIDALKAIESLKTLVDRPDFIPDTGKPVELVFNGLFVTLPTVPFINALKKISTLCKASDDDTTVDESLYRELLSMTPNLGEDDELWPAGDPTVTHNDLDAARMSEDEKIFIRTLQLVTGGAYHHNTPVSVVFEEHSVDIPASQLLSLLDISAPRFTDDLLKNNASVIHLLEAFFQSDGAKLRDVQVSAAQSTAFSHITFHIDQTTINIPTSTMLTLMDLLPPDLDTAKNMVVNGYPDQLDWLTPSAARVLRAFQSLSLFSSEHDTIDIVAGSSRVTLLAPAFLALMRILPVVPASDNDFNAISAKKATSYMTIDPVIFEWGDIVIEPVQIWPWTQFTIGSLLPEFRSASYQTLPSDTTTEWLADEQVEVATVLPRQLLRALSENTEDLADDINQRIVGELSTIHADTYPDDDFTGVGAVSVGSWFDIDQLEYSHRVYMPTVDIAERQITADQPILDTTVYFDNVASLTEMTLPAIDFEDDHGELINTVIVPPDRSIVRFDVVNDDGWLKVQNAPFEGWIDVTDVQPKAVEIAQDILSGNLLDERDITNTDDIPSLIARVEEVLVNAGQDLEALNANKSVIEAAVATLLANIAALNKTLTYKSEGKESYPSQKLTEQDIKEDGKKVTYSSADSEYTSTIPDSKNIGLDTIKDTYPSEAWGEEVKELYVSEIIREEGDPNNDFIIVDYYEKDGQRIRVSQPKGIRFLLQRLFEMFISMMGKKGPDDDEALATLALKLKKIVANTQQGDLRKRMSILFDEEDIYTTNWLQSFLAQEAPDKNTKTDSTTNI